MALDRISFFLHYFDLIEIAQSLFVRSNGSALSCGAEKFHYAENETSSR
jgi:hypothetical protein